MVELIVENESLDLFPNETISLTLAVNDMASIESREGNYSNKFTIPSTAKNNSILGYPNELNLVTGFKPTKSRNSVISIDGLDVQRGFIQVEQYNQKEKEFSVSFFSGNTEWIDEISDLNLRDLDLSDFKHTYDSATIAASFGNKEGYIYPFINYGRYVTNGGNNTVVEDWKPSIFTHTLMSRLFSNIDWKLKGSLLTDPIYLKHIIPFSIKNVEINEDIVDLVGFGSTIERLTVVNRLVGTPLFYPDVNTGNVSGNYDNTTYTYTASETIEATITASWWHSDNTFTDRLQVRVNGIVVQSGAGWGRYVDYKGIIQAGDTVTITLNRTISGQINTKSYFTLTPTDRVVEGMDFPLSSSLPDMNQDDFVKDIFNQFGAIFTEDSISKTVFINKFETIKDNIVNAIDWSSKLDLSRDIEVDYTELVSGYGKKNTLKYEDNTDSEKAADLGIDIKGNIGNGSFEIDNDFLTKEEELFKGSFCSSELMETFNSRAKILYIPRYVDGSVDVQYPTLDPKPRCAILGGVVDVDEVFINSETSINITGSLGNTNVTSLPFTYFHADITGIETIDTIGQGLSFGNPYISNIQKNLLDTYYQDFQSILNNPRRVTAYFLLNERDINNLDFLIPIYLGGELNNYFYINKISDYRPNNNGVTKVELVLIA